MFDRCMVEGEKGNALGLRREVSAGFAVLLLRQIKGEGMAS